MVITGAADREFQVNDGNVANKKFFVDTATGNSEIAGTLKIDEKLKFQVNSIENADIGGTNSFGEILTVGITGTGTGYTDGSYSACTILSLIHI